MGRSVSAYSCPCGFVGTKKEFTLHKRKCGMYRNAMTNDAIFKLLGNRTIKRRK